MAAGVLLVVLLWGAAPAWAQRAHEADFYARFTAGPAYMESEANSISSGESGKLSGEGVDFTLAVGAITVPNWAAHVNFWGWSAFSPDANFNPDALNFGTSMNLFGFGAGITWIWMPYNVYFTVAPGFAVLRTKGPGIESEVSDRGFAWDAGIGKEWWFSETTAWGLGLGGGYHSARSPNIANRRWVGWHLALRLSITTN